jgi:WD40 repeat protein
VGYSELFATCSREDIRVWNSRTCAELLRVQIPNLDCFCVAFSRDGRAVLSGWSDGKIRSRPAPPRPAPLLPAARGGSVHASEL